MKNHHPVMTISILLCEREALVAKMMKNRRVRHLRCSIVVLNSYQAVTMPTTE